ncbi:MAG: glycosyltransferase family 2 protein [Methanobacteriota archaeon]|nr:MAG: glycosyltransferase family 2 protein [Euryarchaeota archaeon]
MSEVSVVIPTMNEEASIGRVIDEVRKALGGRLLEILVVDTDSRDRTREIATAKGARVISEPRRGYGRAYQTGFREARGTYLATLDADLTYPADRLPDFLAALESGRADFVSGERLSHLAGGAMSGMHRIGNAILNAAFHLLFRAPIRDSQSAPRRLALPRDPRRLSGSGGRPEDPEHERRDEEPRVARPETVRLASRATLNHSAKISASFCHSRTNRRASNAPSTYRLRALWNPWSTSAVSSCHASQCSIDFQVQEPSRSMWCGPWSSHPTRTVPNSTASSYTMRASSTDSSFGIVSS